MESGECRQLAEIKWNGTQEEKDDLLAAVQRHCACGYNDDGFLTDSCAAHQMLVTDQRALNGLLWNRHLAPAARGGRIDRRVISFSST